jgi:hypothetical protein
MNKQLPQSLIDRKQYVTQLLRDCVLPTKKNFLPLTYDMRESYFGSIVGGETKFVYLPIDTSHMTVLSILQEEERIIKERKKGSLKVVNQNQQEEMLESMRELSLLVSDKDYETDKEKIECILTEYPELKGWLDE